MPEFTSQRQRRFFYAVAEGTAKASHKGLTKKKARQAISENEGRRGLPERAPKR